MSGTLYIDNSNVVELRELKNSVTGLADTGATVTVTLKDASGVNVAGQSWPAAMAHDSSGTYRATLSDEVVLTEGAVYTAIVSVTGSGGQIATFNCKSIAQVRRCE